MAETDAQLAVKIAQSMLDGSMPLLLGCRKILGPIERLGVDREKPFIIFAGVDSETHHLPLDPEERKQWNAEALN